MAETDSIRVHKRELIDAIEASRSSVAEDLHHLLQAVDVPSRVRQYLAENPEQVAAGTALAGMLISLTVGRARPARHRRRSDTARRIRMTELASLLSAGFPEIAKAMHPQGEAGEDPSYARAVRAFLHELKWLDGRK